MKKPTTPAAMWKLIEQFKWTSDTNYKRISFEFSLLSAPTRKALTAFVDAQMEALNTKFEKDWLAKPGIPVSDDGWSDLRAEVIGRGKKFFNEVTAANLKSMAKNGQYTENFTYGIQMVENTSLLRRYKELKNTVKQMEAAKAHYSVPSEYHRLMYPYCLEMEILYNQLTN